MKVGNDIFNHNANGASEVQRLNLTFNCQFVQSAYVNDLATRYVRQFAVFGNKLNFNPGAGDAFFETATDNQEQIIDTALFNGGKRPNLDGVQSGVGNAPVFTANNKYVSRPGADPHAITPKDHSTIYGGANGTIPTEGTDISNPYAGPGTSRE
jgi:hypothetical protein